MDFSELLNNLFSNDLFKALSEVFGTVLMVVIGVVWNKTKVKLTNLANSSDTNLAVIGDGLKKITNQLELISKENEALIEENKIKDAEIAELTKTITDIGNIVSIGFLDTKGISADAKIKISEAVADLAKHGLNVEKTNEAAKVVAAKTEQAVEVVNQIKEIMETKAKESEEQAATTEAEAIDLMNRIVDTHENQ